MRRNAFFWDGSVWQALGGSSSGLNAAVNALTVYDGQLIAGGVFGTAGTVSVDRIARWDGSAWHPLGSGIDGTSPIVFTLTVHDGELIAGGLGGGLNDIVQALTVYNGELIAGGNFPLGIARWDGSSWQPLGGGLVGVVFGLTVYSGALIAGGSILTAGGFPVEDIAG